MHPDVLIYFAIAALSFFSGLAFGITFRWQMTRKERRKRLKAEQKFVDSQAELLKLQKKGYE
jgi:hypothetical protein